MGDFTGQTTIVTGATGAVGAAIATQLIARGATAVLVGRSQDALAHLVGTAGWNPSQVRCYAVDLAVDANVREFARAIGESCPGVDVLVHAAGAIALGTIEQGTVDDFDRQYQVNVRAPYQLTQALMSRLTACRGQLVYINSSAG